MRPQIGLAIACDDESHMRSWGAIRGCSSVLKGVADEGSGIHLVSGVLPLVVGGVYSSGS